MALGVFKRKQAQVRKGLYPRLRRTVTSRLEVYFEELGLEVSNEDTKDRSPGARCRACPPLFPSTVAGGTSSKPVSWQHVTKAVIDSLKMLDVDTKHFSGISMHRGGISAGLTALVPKPIPFSPEWSRIQMRGPDLHGAARPGGFETYDDFGL